MAYSVKDHITIEWQEIQINDSEYLISSSKQDKTWKFLLTNLKELWIETLTEDQVLEKSKISNPLIDFRVFDYIQCTNDMFSNISMHAIEANLDQIKLRINIDSNMFFKFVLKLSKSDSDQFWEYITQPMCLSSIELLRQHNALLKLVKDKDTEIAEYKAQGAELIRKNIETKPFDYNALKISLEEDITKSYINGFQSISAFLNSTQLCVKRESTGIPGSKREASSTTDVKKEQLRTTAKLITSSMKDKGKVTKNKNKETTIIIPKSAKSKKILNKFIL